MLVQSPNMRLGIRKVGAYVQLAAAGVANAAAIFQVDNLATQLGTRSFKVVRLFGFNNAGANTLLHIGTGVGAGFVDLMPPIQTINGLNFNYMEWELPQIQAVAVDLTAYPVAATVDVGVEVEVFF